MASLADFIDFMSKCAKQYVVETYGENGNLNKIIKEFTRVYFTEQETEKPSESEKPKEEKPKTKRKPKASTERSEELRSTERSEETSKATERSETSKASPDNRGGETSKASPETSKASPERSEETSKASPETSKASPDNGGASADNRGGETSKATERSEELQSKPKCEMITNNGKQCTKTANKEFEGKRVCGIHLKMATKNKLK